MTPKTFDTIAKSLFGEVLIPHGFSCERSRHCSFYREVSPGFYHLIVPDPLRRSANYDIKVFATASVFDSEFNDRFPDELGVPTDSWCYLSESGIGMTQGLFNCKHPENFQRRFEMTIKNLLTQIALPYLDRLKSLRDLLPLIRVPVHRAIAVHFLQGPAGLHGLLKERDRYRAFNSTDSKVVQLLAYLDRLIGDE